METMNDCLFEENANHVKKEVIMCFSYFPDIYPIQ